MRVPPFNAVASAVVCVWIWAAVVSVNVFGQQWSTASPPRTTALQPALEASSEVVDYTSASGSLRLRGVLFRSGGAGQSPAIVFLHGGSGASDKTVATIGRTFVSKGILSSSRFVAASDFLRGAGSR